MQSDRLGEHSIIENIRRRFSAADKNILLGIGDDCAAVDCSDMTALFFTTDALVEHIHFDLQKIFPFQLGWKSLAVSASDIAAMGGNAKYALVSLLCPPKISNTFIDQLYDGIEKFSDQYQIDIIGGDTSASKNDLMISVTMIGERNTGKIPKRSGAKVGDKIYLTGEVGASSSGLEILLKDPRYLDKSVLHSLTFDYSLIEKAKDRLVARHLLPVPRLREGMNLVSQYPISSMIDLSDGLVGGLKEICRQSKVGAIIYEEKIPFSDDLIKNIHLLDNNLIEYGLYGGEDYELLFTVDENMTKIVTSATMVSCIGEITDLQTGVLLSEKSGKTSPITRSGYEH